MEGRMDHEQAIRQLQREQLEIRQDLDRCVKYITGNGDPTKGLLWLAADQARIVANLSALHEANRVLIEKHGDDLRREMREQRDGFFKALDTTNQTIRAHQELGHYRRQSLGQRLAVRALEQTIGIGIVALLALLALGAGAWLKGGGP